jgi:hypothetical protein
MEDRDDVVNISSQHYYFNAVDSGRRIVVAVKQTEKR